MLSVEDEVSGGIILVGGTCPGFSRRLESRYTKECAVFTFYFPQWLNDAS